MKRTTCLLVFGLMFALAMYGSFQLGARVGYTQGVFFGASIANAMCQGSSDSDDTPTSL